MQSRTRKVVVSQRMFDEETINYLHQNNCEVVIADLQPGEADGNLSHENLTRLLANADAWIVGHAKVTRDLLQQLPQLKVISRRGVGYDRVDVAAAGELGRVVTIASGGNDESVADHTIGLMLAVARRFRESQQKMIAGSWSILQGSDISHKKIGIIGFGRIGRRVAQRLLGFDVEILIVNPSKKAYSGKSKIRYVDLDEALRECDIITLHAPLSNQTKFLIDSTAIEKMKRSAILINAGRGGLVEDAHLLAALKEGRIAGAGLDVFLSEADKTYEKVTSELINLPTVVATPHAAASSKEGIILTNQIAARNVVLVLDGLAPPADCVVADGRRNASVK